jgi:hypothetical protein
MPRLLKSSRSLSDQRRDTAQRTPKVSSVIPLRANLVTGGTTVLRALPTPKTLGNYDCDQPRSLGCEGIDD